MLANRAQSGPGEHTPTRMTPAIINSRAGEQSSEKALLLEADETETFPHLLHQFLQQS